MKCKISGKKSIETLLYMCENEFNNPKKSLKDHKKMLKFMSKYNQPEIVEVYKRMKYELELEIKETKLTF